MTRDIHDRAGLSAVDQKFLAHIENFGWAVTKVFRNQDDTGPDWAYSTGLFSSYRNPEIVIFGLDLDNMHKIVNNIGSAVKKGGRFEAGSEHQEIFARCGCRFRPVLPQYFRAYFGWAIWFYEEDSFPVLQCFWPDKQGKYPWEADCSEFVVSAQPCLYE